jgi:hypothetical protein
MRLPRGDGFRTTLFNGFNEAGPAGYAAQGGDGDQRTLEALSSDGQLTRERMCRAALCMARDTGAAMDDVPTIIVRVCCSARMTKLPKKRISGVYLRGRIE